MPRKHRYVKELVASNADAPIEEQVAEILTKATGKLDEWFLITQWHFDPCEGEVFTSRESLIAELGNVLTVRCGIVAVFHRDRRLSDEEIRPLETEAIGMLGPISRAKAEGRLP